MRMSMRGQLRRPVVLLTVAILSLFGSAALAHPGGVDARGCHANTSKGDRHCHPERAKHSAKSAKSPARPPRPGDEGVFSGAIVWVTDGDTLRVRVKDQDMEFRLADVDAPERDQPYGWKAKLELIDLVRDRQAVLVPRDVDRYGRVVAYLWVGDLNINRELVTRGAAWFYPQYAKDESLYYVEQQARDAQRGLWALPLADRVEPWEWRRRDDVPRKGG